MMAARETPRRLVSVCAKRYRLTSDDPRFPPALAGQGVTELFCIGNQIGRDTSELQSRI